MSASGLGVLASGLGCVCFWSGVCLPLEVSASGLGGCLPLVMGHVCLWLGMSGMHSQTGGSEHENSVKLSHLCFLDILLGIACPGNIVVNVSQRLLLLPSSRNLRV